MAIERRQLYASANGDRWYLARDTDDGHVFVQHQANAPSGGRVTDSEVAAFLARDSWGSEHQELLRLIGTLIGASEL